jgi:hypothetical protein
MSDKQHVIMFHGTSSRFDKSILNDGFHSRPAERASYVLNEDEPHLESFDGTYAALDVDVATSYARKCCGVFGGEPRVFVFRVPAEAIVPDEDEVHFALNCYLAHLLGFDDMAEEDEQIADKPWSRQIAVDVIRKIAPSFGMSDREVEKAAEHLHVMMEKATTWWDGDLYFFHPDGNDQGWASPLWVRRLTQLEGGLALYKREMDQLLHCMAAADPHTAPAGFATFRGRIVEPIRFEEGSAVRIIGYGTPEDPFAEFADPESLSDADIVLDRAMIERGLAHKQSTRPGM